MPHASSQPAAERLVRPAAAQCFTATFDQQVHLIGRKHDAEKLPAVVRDYEAFKGGATKDVPDVPFQMLTSLTLEMTAK